MIFDLITIGDSVVDTVVPLHEAQVLDKDGLKLLAMPFGTKLPSGQTVSMVGGNAANSAVSAARLGLQTAIYTNVGNKDEDQSDLRIVHKFKKENVSTKFIVETADLPSNHNIILDYLGERTILVYHQPWKFNLPDLDKAKWIYLTSLSPSYVQSNLIEQLINYLERSGAKLVYQPGTFQLKLGKKKNAKLLVLTEVFILNLEEAKAFLDFKISDNIPIKKLLQGIYDLGPKRVVITDAEDGSASFDGERFLKIEAFPSKLVEMTGAGDAYASGLLAGMFYKSDLAEAMRWGSANGASVVEQIGPQAGLLTYHRMQEKLKQNSKILAREF